MEIQKQINDIPAVQFWFNLIVLVVASFYRSTWFLIVAIGINALLSGTSWVMRKYWFIFEGLLVGNKLAKFLNNSLERLN